MSRGILVTFEGSEGSGKSTQAKLFSHWLNQQGREAIFLREPGGTEIGEKIREILLNKKYKSLLAETELFLFLAARAQLVREEILPAINSGKIVVLDRFTDATIAYQGYGSGIEIEKILEMNTLAAAGIVPDVTFILDIDAAQGLERAGVKDRIEEKGLDFHKRVRKGYLEIARSNPARVFLLSAEENLDKNQKKIRKIFSEKFINSE